jgi:hypothetical protein
MKMKPAVCIPALVLSLSIAGCSRSYQDSQLVGVWQTTGERKVFKYAFAADHTFTYAAVSPKNLTIHGEWALDANRLTIMPRSNSWTTVITTNREPYRIIALTDATLTLKNLGQDAERPNRTFTRVR